MLDNPIWFALTTEQSDLAIRNESAAHFPSEIGPLGGMLDQSARSYKAAERLLQGDAVGLFLDAEPAPPTTWETLHRDRMYQMVFDWTAQHERDAEIRELTAADVPAMVALAELTEPGPFRSRTIELGGYRGIFVDGRLAAMAGERLHLPEFTEVSAVCTHPDFRGRGYGKRLVLAVMDGILKQDKTPMLHVRCHNPAVRLYESLGFRVRRELHLAVVKCGLKSDYE
jgi:ribosomal protein S18 acetylase RimI-like enzyme